MCVSSSSISSARLSRTHVAAAAFPASAFSADSHELMEMILLARLCDRVALESRLGLEDGGNPPFRAPRDVVGVPRERVRGDA